MISALNVLVKYWNYRKCAELSGRLRADNMSIINCQQGYLLPAIFVGKKNIYGFLFSKTS